MALLISLHLLAAVIWVGGMFYAWMAMRPAVAATVDGAHRGPLWHATLARFFRWVWASVVILLGTGYAMVFSVFGGMAAVGMHVHLMQGIGIVMMLLFAHVYFAPFRRLGHAVAAADTAKAGSQIGQIRRIVGINLLLGLAVVMIASAGRYL
ncbi:MAG: CopD family protein [Alcanivoracaceae bacterium]|nr:CopD family protein [Alcanivoracaceae bacterium]